MRLTALTFLMGLFACVRGEPVPLAEDPDALVILAFADAFGTTTHAQLVQRSGVSQPFTAGDRSFYTFEISPDDLLDPEGRPLDPSLLDELQVRHLSEPRSTTHGTCGRCLSSFGRGPHPVFPGESCMPPLSAPAKLWRHQDGQAISVRREDLEESGVEKDLLRMEAARESLRLEWPGACACERPPAPDPNQPRLRFDPIRPEDLPHPLEAIAQSDDGSVAGISEAFQYVRRADGTQVVSINRLAGPVLAAGAVPMPAGTGYLASIDTGDFGSLEVSHRAFLDDGGTDLGNLPIDGLSEDFNPRGMRRLHLAGQNRLVLFGVNSGRPALAVCGPDGDRIACVEDRFECLGGFNSGVLDAQSFGEDLLALTESHVILATYDGARLQAQCREITSLAAIQPLEASSLGVVDDNKVLICGTRRFNIGTTLQAFLLSVRLRPGTLQAVTSSVTSAGLVPILVNGSRCGDWVHAGPGRIQVTTSGGIRAIASTQTVTITTDRSDWVDVQDPAQNLYVLRELSRAPGWTVYRAGTPSATSYGVKVLRRPAGGPVEEVYAPADPPDGWSGVSAIVPQGDRFVILEQRARAANVVVVGENGSYIVETLPLEIIDQDEVVFGAIRETFDDSIVVVGRRDRQPWVRKFYPDQPERGVVRMPFPELESDAVTAIADVGGPGMLVMTFDGNAFVVTDLDAELLPIDWDDPFTEEEELIPRDLTTGFPDVRYRHATSADGIAWIVGTDLILRARPTDEPPFARAERVAFARGGTTFETELLEKDLTRIGLRCPDEALLSYAESTEVRIAAVRAHPSQLSDGEPVQAESVERSPTTYEAFDGYPDPDQVRPSLRRTPLGIHLDGAGRALFIHSAGRVVVQDGRLTTYLPFFAEATGMTRDGVVLVGGQDRRLAIGVRGDQ